MSPTPKTTARRAFITGGGSGIGLAIAREFAASGIDVTIAGRNVARLKETGLAFVEMDVTDEQSVDRRRQGRGRD